MLLLLPLTALHLQVPALLILGLAPEHATQLYAFELGILSVQTALEDAFIGIAKSGGKPAVIVHDRGAQIRFFSQLS
eukprot:SAG31_NODE_4998_length_2809_cov_1.615129_3_plen_77_part_00